MGNRHWHYPNTFEEKTGLYKILTKKLKNDKVNNIKRDNLMQYLSPYILKNDISTSFLIRQKLY